MAKGSISLPVFCGNEMMNSAVGLLLTDRGYRSKNVPYSSTFSNSTSGMPVKKSFHVYWLGLENNFEFAVTPILVLSTSFNDSRKSIARILLQVCNVNACEC